MNDTRLQNLRPFAASVLGGLAILTVGTTACDQEPLTVTEDQVVAPDGVATVKDGFTLTSPLTPIEPIRPPIIACPGLRLRQQPGSFPFDDGTAQDWIMEGLFNGDTQNRVAALDATPAAWWDGTNAPAAPFADPANNNLGALGMFTVGGFAPAPSGFWREDFISPDLATRFGWQTTNRFSFQIHDDMSAFAPAGGAAINAQLLAEVQKCDGTTTFLRQVDAQGNPIFCAATPGAWVTCTFTFNMAQVQTLRRLHIRVFGTTRAAYEGGLFIDNVRAL